MPEISMIRKHQAGMKVDNRAEGRIREHQETKTADARRIPEQSVLNASVRSVPEDSRYGADFYRAVTGYFRRGR
jgi:hypothetical protein